MYGRRTLLVCLNAALGVFPDTERHYLGGVFSGGGGGVSFDG